MNRNYEKMMGEQIQDIALKYFNLHNELAAEKIIFEKNCETYTIDDSKLFSKEIELDSILNSILKDGQVSSILKRQLLLHFLQLGEKYELLIENLKISVIEYFQFNELIELIKSLENRTCTNIRPPFKGEYLIGLEHIHHGTYASLGFSAILNCINYWYDPQEPGKLKRKKIIEFEKLLVNQSQSVPALMCQIAMHNKMKTGLTGEWLIFQQIKNKNYYLCLAKHDEGDNSIFDNKIKACLTEFPELNLTK